jgi:TolB-like protein
VGAYAASPDDEVARIAADIEAALTKSSLPLTTEIGLAPCTTPKGDDAAEQMAASVKRSLLARRGLRFLDPQSVKAALNEGALAPNSKAGSKAPMGTSLMLVCELTASGGGYGLTTRLTKVADGRLLTSTSVNVAAPKSTKTATAAPGVEARSLDVQLRKLADVLAKRLDELPGELRYQHVAVLPFEEIGSTTKDKKLGLLVASELTTLLARDHGLLLVERSQLTKVVDELALGQTGLTDPSKSAEVGKLAGAQDLVVGTVGEAGDRYVVDARVVEAETGKVTAAEQTSLPAADLVALSAEAVVLRSRTDAVYRSLILPGWGQFYNREPIKGAVVLGAEVVALALAGVFQLQASKAQTDYNNLPAGSDFASAADKVSTYRGRRNLALYGVLTIHLVNVLDAFISGKTFDSATPVTTAGTR